MVRILLVSNDTILTEGESALLTCVGSGQLSWSFKGAAVGNSSLVTIYEQPVTETLQQSSLLLCGVRMADAGGYI